MGFAGRRELSDSESRVLDDSLDRILNAVGNCLSGLAPGVPVKGGANLKIASFYSRECPVLRIVTGLCEGADDRAAESLSRIRINPDTPGAEDAPIQCLSPELAAVLPFFPEVYRNSRASDFRAQFDTRLSQCAWVIALDGLYDKPAEETPLSKERRARAYRAQSAVLLRQTDILIAAANPDQAGSAGGTLETVREALAFDLPVVFIHTGKEDAKKAIYLIEPEELLANVLAAPASSVEDCERRLREWVVQLTADPDVGTTSGTHQAEEARRHGEDLLLEYFDRPESPTREARHPFSRLRKWAWDRFEGIFKAKEMGDEAKGLGLGHLSGTDQGSCAHSPEHVSLIESQQSPSLAANALNSVSFAPDAVLKPYLAYRARATTLNYHYSALYRGTFLLNYALAIFAVILAAVSLTLLGTASHTPLVDEVVTVLEKAGLSAEKAAVNPASPGWLIPVLIVLGAAKIALLLFISFNTRRANKARWNDRAIDTRYLAERLRGLFYLPRAASQQPPAAAPPQFASRAVRQSAVDWLCDAIVRAVSPADLEEARPAEIASHDGNRIVAIRHLFVPDPHATLLAVRDSWIRGQIAYHSGNTRTMHAMHHGVEALQKWLGRIVVGIVAFDLVLLGVKALHWPEFLYPFAKVATPWLIAASAILPAVVAALSGIRFQSECQALAERSDVMRAVLAGRKDGAGGRLAQAGTLIAAMEQAAANPATDPGSWSHDALRFTERLATDFVQEAAEWSVLYAKEVSEPG